MTAVVVERDYVLTHVVEALTALEPSRGLVFKSGTALRLCFYDDYRYSADLDFSLVDLGVADAVELMRRACERCVQEIAFPQMAPSDDGQLVIRYINDTEMMIALPMCSLSTTPATLRRNVDPGALAPAARGRSRGRSRVERLAEQLTAAAAR